MTPYLRIQASFTDREKFEVQRIIAEYMREDSVIREMMLMTDYKNEYKRLHAPSVAEEVWSYHDTTSALFDEWIEHEHFHIVIMCDGVYHLLHDLYSIHTLGSTRWSEKLLSVLRTRMWRGRPVKVIIALSTETYEA